MRIIIIGVLLLSVYLSICHSSENVTFTTFRLKFNKNYHETEITLREQVYNSNLAKIEDHNKRYQEGLETYEMGINQYTDMTEEEFVNKFNTFQLDDAVLNNTDAVQDTSSVNVDDLPKNIDWRDKGIVTSVKNQGTCGGCWAFSATGTLEGQFALKYNLTSLSEQQLLDCNTANKGCQGDVVQDAINYVVEHGITTEGEYAYRGAVGTCVGNKTVAAVAKGYINIRVYNETDLKVAVAQIGPVSVAINANPLQLYSRGILNGTCSDAINHGVLAVGYGTLSTGAQYWIIKNSWGKLWGESGYYRLAMGIGTGLCGIARQACYPVGITDHVIKQNNSVGGTIRIPPNSSGGDTNFSWQNILYILALLPVVFLYLCLRRCFLNMLCKMFC